MPNEVMSRAFDPVGTRLQVLHDISHFLAVSYTHLDVYKRQVYMSTFCSSSYYYYFVNFIVWLLLLDHCAIFPILMENKKINGEY